MASMAMGDDKMIIPLLFNIYTADIHMMLKDIMIIQYADDFCLYTKKSKYEETISHLSTVMNKFNNWCLDKGFTMFQEKTMVTYLTRHNISKIRSVSIHGFTFNSKT